MKKDKKLKITENYSEKEVEGTEIVKIFFIVYRDKNFWDEQFYCVENFKIIQFRWTFFFDAHLNILDVKDLGH